MYGFVWFCHAKYLVWFGLAQPRTLSLSLACIAGTGGIILVAPSLYDTRSPIDILVSKV